MAAPAAAPGAALAAAPAADPWIHGSISFIMNRIPIPYNITSQKMVEVTPGSIMAEKSRGWLEIGRFLNQIDRADANYFSKNFRTNKRANKQTKQSKQTKNFRKQIQKIFEKNILL